MERGTFSTRLGFILVSAGCAIGLGNVWRFPFITGKYGGASFVLIYLFFLAILGLPIMVAEFAVGRASKRSAALSFDMLEPKGTKWHLYKYGCILGNAILMMYYTTITGWMFYYLYKMVTGAFVGMAAKDIGGVLGGLVSDPVTMIGYMALAVILGFGVCYLGVEAGVERITKFMMTCLLFLMIALAVNSVMLPGGENGLAYFLQPDFSRLTKYGANEVIFAAMGQAFFTLSLGIIFPACSAFNVDPGAGPNLLFITLPNVFNHMAGGQFWGSLFFLFMTFAAMSTVIAVFENLIACICDLTGWERKSVIKMGTVAIIVLSLPCIFGFNIWSSFQPLGNLPSVPAVTAGVGIISSKKRTPATVWPSPNGCTSI